MSQEEISPPPVLDPAEQVALRTMAGSMIPVCAELGLPGADDVTIFDRILEIAQASPAAVRQALHRLEEAAGAPFARLDQPGRVAAAVRLRDSWPDSYMLLVGLVVRSYYSDDRVMRSIGMEPRPPFPKGFEVPAGDWSLLDAVRARGKIYRDVP